MVPAALPRCRVLILQTWTPGGTWPYIATSRPWTDIAQPTLLPQKNGPGNVQAQLQQRRQINCQNRATATPQSQEKLLRDNLGRVSPQPLHPPPQTKAPGPPPPPAHALHVVPSVCLDTSGSLGVTGHSCPVTQGKLLVITQL
ncbi:hypothetical protein H8959_011526 [Pygathrix nigripes]